MRLLPLTPANWWFLGAVGVAAAVTVVVFNPAVSTEEIQRRDRLSQEARFVDITYRYFLGRPADEVGRAGYEARYARDGAEAVVVDILESREFLQKHPDGRLASSDLFDGADAIQSEPRAIAAKFVQLIQSGSLQPGPVVDWPGRIGFVLMLLSAAAAVIGFQRLSGHRLSGTALHVYLPREYIVGLFAALAAIWWLNSQAVFYSFVPGAVGYAEWLDRITSLSMSRGVANVWTPYPQGTQMVLVVLASAATTLDGWLHSDIWTSYTLFRWLFEAVFLVAPSVVIVSVAYELGMLISPASATFAGTIVAFSFAPIYYGLASTLVTDPLSVLLMVLAIWFSVRERSVWAGLAVGLGGALKLIPIVVLVPMLILAHRRRSRLTMVVVPAVTLLCVFLPFALANSEIFLSPFRWQTARPAWESWYSFVNWLVGAPHEYAAPAFEDVGLKHDFGWVFWGITPSLTSLLTPVPSGPIRWDNVISAIGASMSLVVIFTAKSNHPRALIRWSLYALVVTLFWNIGWSPQYELYLAPLIALSFETPLVAIGGVVAIQVLTFLEYPLFLLWAYFYGGSAVWLAWGSTVARYLVLAWLALFVVRTEGSVDAFKDRLRTVGLGVRRLAVVRRQAAAIAGFMLAIFMVALPLTVQAQGLNQTFQSCGPSRYMPAEPVTFAPDRDWQLPGGWFFSQAGGATERGFTILDDNEAMMWSEFNRLGGWQALGFPASRRFTWHGLLSQASQRAVLQWSPITGQVDFANVLDLMHDDGDDMDLWRLKQIPSPVDVDEAGLPYETIAARRLAWLDSRPAIKDKYCKAPGGADPVQLWGLPTSEPVNVSDSGGEVYVLRTQRAAFQEWVGGADWAAPGQVTVILAGDLAKEFKLLPAEAIVPEPAPAR